jgi:hypothetical protein
MQFERHLAFYGFLLSAGKWFHFATTLTEYFLCSAQGEGLIVCYDVKNMDRTAHSIGASKFPLLQQENSNIELLRAAKHIF